MLGKRGRIGLLVPATNTVAEYELSRMLPADVSISTARVVSSMAESEVQRLSDYRLQVIKAAKEVQFTNPRVIAWACTSGSFIQGAGYDVAMVAEVQSTTSAQVFTTSTAVLEGIAALGVKKIAMGTPYRDSVAAIEKRFLEDSVPGLEVVNVKNLNVIGPGRRGLIEPEEVYRLGLAVNVPEAQALFLSCTDVRTLEAIPRLEEALQKPVISSNQCTLWAALKRLGVETTSVVGSLSRS